MLPPFDIFRHEEDGGLRWLQAAEDLATAKARVQEIGASAPGVYMIFSQRTGNKIAIEVDARGRMTSKPEQTGPQSG